MMVYLLWHFHHYPDDDGVIHHVDEETGAVNNWNDDLHDSKILGAFATEADAPLAIEDFKLLEGFRDEPECFYVGEYLLGERH